MTRNETNVRMRVRENKCVFLRNKIIKPEERASLREKQTKLSRKTFGILSRTLARVTD